MLLFDEIQFVDNLLNHILQNICLFNPTTTITRSFCIVWRGINHRDLFGLIAISFYLFLFLFRNTRDLEPWFWSLSFFFSLGPYLNVGGEYAYGMEKNPLPFLISTKHFLYLIDFTSVCFVMRTTRNSYSN